MKWDVPEGTSVELRQSTDAKFSDSLALYQGEDPGKVVNGLAEGTYFFQIRTEGGEWSPPLEVKVEFFSRFWLGVLLTTGFFVVVATIGTIVVGAIRTNKEEEQ